MVAEALAQFVFELGKVLLKVELSKNASGDIIRSSGISEAETIVLQKMGKFWNQQNWLDRPDGLVLVTTHRLVFLSKVKSITTQTDFLSFPFGSIEHLRASRVMFVSPAIKFETEGKPFVFTFFSGAEDVRAAIESGEKRRIAR